MSRFQLDTRIKITRSGRAHVQRTQKGTKDWTLDTRIGLTPQGEAFLACRQADEAHFDACGDVQEGADASILSPLHTRLNQAIAHYRELTGREYYDEGEEAE